MSRLFYKDENGEPVELANKESLNHLPYLTTAPTEDNPDGLKIVVLDNEPAQKYNGYIYFIK